MRPYIDRSGVDDDEPGDADGEDDDRQHRVPPESDDGSLVAEDHPVGVDHRQGYAEDGEPAVLAARGREDGLPCDEVGDEKEHHLEGVATEDVCDRELVVAETDGGEAGADLGQSRGNGKNGRAEDDAVDV